MTNNIIDFNVQSKIILNDDFEYKVVSGYVSIFAMPVGDMIPGVNDASGENDTSLIGAPVFLGQFDQGEIFLSLICPKESQLQIVAKLSFDAQVERAPLQSGIITNQDDISNYCSWINKTCASTLFDNTVSNPSQSYKEAERLFVNSLPGTNKSRDMACSRNAGVSGQKEDKNNNMESDVLDSCNVDVVRYIWLQLFERLPAYIKEENDEKSHKITNIKKVQKQAVANKIFKLKQAIFYHDIDRLHDDDYGGNDTEIAFRTFCKLQKIKIKSTQVEPRVYSSISDELTHLATNLKVQITKATLNGNWWKSATIPYLAYTTDGKPKLLIPGKSDCYYLLDPATKEKQLIDENIARQFDATVFSISPSLGDDPVGFKRFYKSAFLGNIKNLIILVCAFLIVSLLGLISPIVTGYLVDQGIANANLALIWQLMSIVLCLAVVIGMFTLVKNIVMVRFEVIMNHNLQSAVMSRVLKLPLNFFSEYAVGDMSNRILSVDSIVKAVATANINGLLGFAFSFASFIVMFYYSWILALIVLTVTVIMLGIYTVFTLYKIPCFQKGLDTVGDNYAFLYQAINGISQVKLFNKEDFVEAQWAELYGGYRREMLKARMLGSISSTFITVAKLATLILLFMIIHYWYTQGVAFRSFITFFTSYVQFAAGLAAMPASIAALIPAIIYYRRLKPILQAEVEEKASGSATPTYLSGEIRVNSLGFHYVDQGLAVLDNISFKVNPGEFLGVVGVSGAGKSTLFKLLLGFYPPSKGAITYDGIKLQNCDSHSLRQQIGVVLQSDHLISASILENIIGNNDIAEDDAWQIASLIGLDKFIESLPMGMQTHVSQNRDTISGGEKQLILLARALVNNPKLLLLDEATSALDNESQAKVCGGIDSLNISRIVIAHRLSTIMHADRIIVMEEGRIAAQGTFQELLEVDGLFAQLAHEQGFTSLAHQSVH